MLNDEQKRTCFETSGHHHPSEVSQDEFDAFEEGIAYAQTWRSMESAPKDGTPIVLIGYLCGYPAHHKYACVSWWSETVEISPAYAVGWHFVAPGYANLFAPTGWLPLPPTEAK